MLRFGLRCVCYRLLIMEQVSVSQDIQQGFEKLSAKDKQELNQFVTNETQKAQIQGGVFRCPSWWPSFADQCIPVIHELTSTCFRKCVSSKISAATLDRYEEPCLRNCVDRFMDTQNSVLSMLQKMQSS